ncbi:hypothetical protein BH10BAC5_BH10BAC5_28800 [soil metagenome]
MEGTISFPDSLSERISLLSARKSEIGLLIQRLKRKISPSIKRNKNFFITNADNILIVSGGFKEFIEPIVKDFGIPEKNIYANKFIFDKSGFITGFDRTNLLAQPGGKIRVLENLRLKGEIFVIGDGYTDYELKKAGLVNKFFAFTENIERQSIIGKSDHVTPNFDEFLYLNKLPMSVSFPKNRIKVLLLENIHSDAKKIFKEEGYTVETLSKSLSETELCEAIKDISILGIRSKTQVTEKVLQNAKKLLSIGAFCIGTNQIDLGECMTSGVAVFNAPFSNTRSVVELALGEIILLMRNIIDKSRDLHSGKWNKSAANSFEVRGKKLGIIGYGNIGTQLSILAENLGMDVYFYDKIDKLALGNTTKCSTLKELFKKCDIITVHIDGDSSNENFISEKEFKQMKYGTIFLNLSRGHVIDIKALAKNIKSGKIKGAAVDVYPEEPLDNTNEFYSELQNLPNVILTPHIGGSTEEAQKNIAEFVPDKIIDFINSGNSFFSVNFPNLRLPSFENAHRLIHIHDNVPGILAKINLILSKHNINIMGQYLKTNETIGYVITDIDKNYRAEVINELRNIPNTIKFRVLY